MGEVNAFGIEPSSRKFHLRLARYMGLCDAIREFREREAASGITPETLRLLDVGAGHGRTLMYLKAQGLDDNIEFYGVDNAQARRNRLFESHRWDYRLLDVEQGLPFDNGFFDIVICEQVLEHLKRPEFVISEISRVTRPHGMAILGVPNFPPGADLVRRHIVPRIDRLTGKSRDHEQVFTQARFTSLIEGSGEFRVRRVQAFRCISGGLLKGLENYEWWYNLSRAVATAASPLAIEIQVVADRVPSIQSVSASDYPSDRHSAPHLRRSSITLFALCALALMSTGWILSDTTHASIFSDSTGVFRPLSVGAWIVASIGIAYCLRTRMGTAIAFAGTALAAGAIEGRFIRAITNSSNAEALSRVFSQTTPWTERAMLFALVLTTSACVITAIWYAWLHMRIRGGLHQTWVKLMFFAFGIFVLSELIETSLMLAGSSPGASLTKAMYALEEGMKLALPIIILTACVALAAVLSEPNNPRRTQKS